MDKEKLDQTLQQLHGELLQIELVDASDRERLQQLMADVKELLEQEEEAPADRYKRLADQLSESIKHFEVSHTTITGVMDRTIKMLARMGI
jgi:molecular chaperone DnaK (HSP70)